MKSGIFVIGLAFASTAIAHASETQAPILTEAVSYVDLNIASAAGQAILRERIKAAAGRVCELGGMASMEEFQEAAVCYRQSYHDGLRQMNQLVAEASGSSVLAASVVTVSAK